MTIDITAPLLPPSKLSYVGRWRVGDFVALDETFVEIETDGATLEPRAPATGVLSSIVLADGQSVQSGDRVGTITEY
jgi:2-oxoglutarate dehydrogenase E2 component (dihydrolipoamide succinyltransferase)